MLRLFLLYFIHLKQICKAEVSLIILIYESKVFLFTLIILMTGAGCINSVNAATISSPDGDCPIIVQPFESETPGNPRGPVFNPFTAHRLNNTVVLESDTSYGLVNVTLVSTAGDYITTLFDTDDVSILDHREKYVF